MSDNETLRDKFAAAALTGVLAGRLDRVEESHADVWAHMAGTLADAMLRERARNGASDARETVPPVLWAVQFHGEPLDPECVFATASTADEYQRCTRSPSRVVRLYGDPPPPTLTDAEREAVVAADSELSAIGHHRTPDKAECLRISNLLRSLLARMGGER